MKNTLEDTFLSFFSHNNFEKSRKFTSTKAYSTQPVKDALAILGNPQYKFKTVHVAGTVGKGSTTLLIGNFIKQINPTYKIGYFLSPHLTIINERIQIDSQFISDHDFQNIFDTLASKIDISTLSFFDCLTVMAFMYFEQSNVDWAIIETGLGGRLDSTNNLKPEFCVLTPIDKDHIETLGGSIESITFEKAGIIKQCPTYSYPQKDIIIEILKNESNKQNSNFYIYNQSLNTKDHYLKNNFKICKWICEDFFQKEISNNLDISHINIIGRIEKISEQPIIFFDSAHNEIGTKALNEWITLEYSKNNSKYNIYCNTLKERNLEDLLKPFIHNSAIKNIYLLPTLEPNRFYNEQDIHQNNTLKDKVKTIDTYNNFITLLNKEFIHIITGSMYLYKMYALPFKNK